MLTGACVTLAVLALSNLFDDYKDSTDSQYVEAALIPLGLALFFLTGGVLALRRLRS